MMSLRCPDRRMDPPRAPHLDACGADVRRFHRGCAPLRSERNHRVGRPRSGGPDWRDHGSRNSRADPPAQLGAFHSARSTWPNASGSSFHSPLRLTRTCRTFASHPNRPYGGRDRRQLWATRDERGLSLPGGFHRRLDPNDLAGTDFHRGILLQEHFSAWQIGARSSSC